MRPPRADPGPTPYATITYAKVGDTSEKARESWRQGTQGSQENESRKRFEEQKALSQYP